MTGVVEAGLDTEEFGLVCKCEGDTVDRLLNRGSVSNLVSEDRRDVVHNIRNETTYLIGVFGRSRIVSGSGAICISQRQFGEKFQMIE